MKKIGTFMIIAAVLLVGAPSFAAEKEKPAPQAPPAVQAPATPVVTLDSVARNQGAMVDAINTTGARVAHLEFLLNQLAADARMKPLLEAAEKKWAEQTSLAKQAQEEHDKRIEAEKRIAKLEAEMAEFKKSSAPKEKP